MAVTVCDETLANTSAGDSGPFFGPNSDVDNIGITKDPGCAWRLPQLNVEPSQSQTTWIEDMQVGSRGTQFQFSRELESAAFKPARVEITIVAIPPLSRMLLNPRCQSNRNRIRSALKGEEAKRGVGRPPRFRVTPYES
jgi:hypothetical protein